jgi:hypothetical protein
MLGNGGHSIQFIASSSSSATSSSTSSTLDYTMAAFAPHLFQIVRELGRYDTSSVLEGCVVGLVLNEICNHNGSGATATVYEAIYDGREQYAIKSIERHQLCM